MKPDVTRQTPGSNARSRGSKQSPDPASGIDFADVINATPCGIVVTGRAAADSPILFANTAFYELTGYSPQEVLGRDTRFLHGTDTDPAAVSDIAAAVEGEAAIRREVFCYRKDGRAFWNDICVQPRRNSSGEVVGFVETHLDVTERRLAREARSVVEGRLEGIIGNLPGYIFQRVRKPDGSVSFSFFSPSYWHLLGFPEVEKPEYEEIVKHIDPRDLERVRAAVSRSMEDLSPATIEFRAIAADGKQHWLRTYSTPRKLANGDVVWDGVGIDITTERASKDALAYIAYHDPLTGLCNRELFTRSLEEAVTALPTARAGIVAFAIDLDEFQEINDTLGSAVGDAVLHCVAERLERFAGPSGLAARLGGDEFGVFWPDEMNATSLLDSAGALCRDLSRPMVVGGHEIIVEACVGATIYGFDDRKKAGPASLADEIIKQSNLALAEAKRSGRGVHRLYAEDLDGRERDRVILRQSLQRAVGEEQFRLHYHPLVDLRSGQIIGAEALVRWAHPELGMQQPDRFIPLAEATGLIVPLGRWVLRSAFHDLRTWERHGIDPPRVSVNISSVQLRDPDFITIVDDAVRETGCDPRRIDFELTESVLIEASNRMLGVLNALKMRGFRLALDDFGTGYSSFQYLRALPVDKVKIDQTFVRRMAVDSSDAAIVRAIMTVARSLSLEIIAEGIETLAQRDFLRNEGCPIGQGYLFSLPLPGEEFRQLLERRVVLPLWEKPL